MRYKNSQKKLLELLPLEILERMTEIKFFRICEKFFKVQGDLTAVFNFIECVSVLGTINIEALKLIAQKMMFNTYMEPTKKELILMMGLEGFSMNEIADILHCSKRDISAVFSQNEEQLQKLYPKCEPSELKEILRFMGVFETLQNLKYK
jgi:predicted DNA-binding protein YlxM (UPF0122 family)